MNFMTLGLENMVTITLAIVSFIIVIYAQIKINTTYSKYKGVKNKKGLTGCEVARQILDKHGLENIYIVETKGSLSDHYDPSRKVIRLSKDIFSGDSIAALAVAAHECGHAIQDKDNYTFMKIRSKLVPVVNLVSYMGYFVLFISIFAGMTGYLMFGILTILATILFQLVTLPVEFDASKRALSELETMMFLDNNEHDGAKKMLGAAAMTYVASLISSLLNLLRLIIMFQDRD